MILCCGDTFLRTCDNSNPFALIVDMLSDSMVCINLETALNGENKKEKAVCLCVDEAALDGLPDEVRLVTIVNNHSGDSGDPNRLACALRERGKTVVGPENPSAATLTISGISVEFLAAYFALPRLRTSYGGGHADNLERLLRDSRAERRIVNLHWGYEHTDMPAPFQRRLAYRLIDAGADLIIGHHPHVPQGWEIYREKPIYYSLGNFNFWQLDGEASETHRWGYMVQYDLRSGETQPIPYRVNENYQPNPVLHEDKRHLLLKLDGLSELARSTDMGVWLATEYADWYKHELGVWTRHCLQSRSPFLWLKWFGWLFTPMQLTFYAHAVRSWLAGLFGKA